ncbi:DUF4129 domain-containing protein [Stratiformator vulcanicus]|uniref:Protein-glutamine gamma-glutamyltransferase-like C-terminal domain-containing protein n=1 Tax=Stratiformator vulcanicus TaxID=2527980 RepID=A0A517QXD1_9PLAN|nr:DUF4129 domain-containing protein [Stratiformator vulcanicus]QDT36309.1 hypothetical protein Pan189_06650 [Stratiformator vulcanicus]
MNRLIDTRQSRNRLSGVASVALVVAAFFGLSTHVVAAESAEGAEANYVSDGLGWDDDVFTAEEIRDAAESVMQSPDLQRFADFEGQASGGEKTKKEPETAKQPQSSRSNQTSIRSAGLLGELFGGLLHLFAYGLIGIVVLAIVYLVFRALSERQSRGAMGSVNEATIVDVEEEGVDAGAVGLGSDQRRDAAVEAAREGRFGEAIALLLIGLLARLERAGMIRPRRGLTHFDYLRAARSEPSLYEALKAVLRIYHPIGFGRRSADRTAFEQSLSAYDRATVPVAEATT